MTTHLSFPADDLRASDSEREEVAGLLRTATEEGRLDVDELSARLERVYAAKLHRELAAQVDDLPVAPPSASPPRATVSRTDGASRALARAGGYVAVGTLLVVIWALTGAGTFWPVWFLIFGAFGIFGHGRHGSCAHRRGHRHRDRGSIYV